MNCNPLSYMTLIILLSFKVLFESILGQLSLSILDSSEWACIKLVYINF